MNRLISREPAGERSERLESLQLLRAIAAGMIVLLHANGIWEFGPLKAIDSKLGAGVDLFFVISGFVIVYASRPYFASPGGWLAFLVRRMIRIVPLYWMALTFRLIVLAGGALIGVKAFPTITDILTSYFFIPYDSQGFGDAYPFPILDLGWSLNYEMFFYLAFAGFIFLPIAKAVAATALTLCLGVVVGFFWDLPMPINFWFRPIVLEFLAGMMIAFAFIRGLRISGVTSVFLIILGLSFWTLIDIRQFASYGGPGFYSFPRFFVFGSVAILILLAATLTRGLLLGRFWRKLARLGDSSYALYLLHPFIFLAFKVLFTVWEPSGALRSVMLFPIVFCTIVVAHLFHLLVEKPMIDFIRKRVIAPRSLAEGVSNQQA